MNHVYRLKRSGRTQQLQPVPETARAAGKGKRTGKTLAQTVTATLASVALGGMATLAHAQQAPPAANQLPQGGVVTRGSAHIVTSTSGSTALMSVNQSSQRAVIDWASFNVGSQAKVQFNQPSSSAVTLNNILGHNASQIYGQISANGQVFLSNPNGVYFSPTAQVNVGGLVATTGKANADEFMAGKVTFNRDGSIGSVVNEGRLSAAAGGYIALLAPEVRNQGVVIAQAGSVALASGEAITLNFNHTGTGLAGITTTPQAIAALVENRSAVVTEGGQIILSAHALASLQGAVVKNSGQLSATSLSTQGGKIVLMGDSIALTGTSQIQASGATGGGTVLVGGDWQGSGDTRQATQVTMAQGASIEANATGQGDGGKVVLWSDIHKPNSITAVHGVIKAEGGPQGGNGGKVETSAHHLDIGGARVSTEAPQGHTGEWLLDPYNITINDAGPTSNITSTSTSYTANNDSSVIQISSLVSALVANNVTIATGAGGGQNGDITIANPLSWTGLKTLTLNAAGSIVLDANVSWTNTVNTMTWSAGTGGLAGTGNITMPGSGNGTGFSITQGGNSTYAGVISGAGDFTKNGNGTLILTGTNTYTGDGNTATAATNVGLGGTLQVGNGGSSGALGSGWIKNLGTLAFNRSDTSTISQAMQYTVVSPAVTSTGLMKIVAGTWQMNASDRLSPKSVVEISSGAVLDLKSYTNSVGGLTGSGTVTSTAPTGVLQFANAVDTRSEFSGQITGSMRVVMGGLGTQALSGVNTYSGTNPPFSPPTVINYGTLEVSNSSALGAGDVQLNAFSGLVGTLAINGVSLSNNVATLNAPGTNVIKSISTTNASTLSGTISATGKPMTFSTAADSKLVLSGTLNAGTMQEKFTPASGGEVQITGPITSFAGSTLTLDGPGKLTLAGNNSAGNFALQYAANNTGTIRLASDTALGLSTIGVTVPEGATLELGKLDGSNLTIGNKPLTLASSTTASGGGQIVNLAGANVWAGDVTLNNNSEVTVNANSALNLSSTGSTVATSSQTYFDLNGNLTFGRLTGGSDASYVSAGSGVLSTNTLYGLGSVSGLYVRLNTSTGVFGSVYGDAPVYSLGFYTAVSGGNLVVLSATDYSGYNAATTFSGMPSNTSIVGTYSVTYTSGVSISNANYRLMGAGSSVNWSISPKTLSLDIPGASRVYDGTAAISPTGSVTLLGVINGDSVSFGGTLTGFVDKNVGANKLVVYSGTALTGAAASNYTLPVTPNSNTEISAKALTISGLSSDNKTYDGTTTAVVHGSAALQSSIAAGTGSSNDGLAYTSDAVSLSGTPVGTFNNKNVATASTVSFSGLGLTGGDALNYTLTPHADASHTISAQALTISGITAQNKIYDGNTVATLNSANVVKTGLVAGDVVSVSATGTFADANVGVGKSVYLLFSHGGADVGNYTITDQIVATADISAPLTTTAVVPTQAIFPTLPVVRDPVLDWPNRVLFASSQSRMSTTSGPSLGIESVSVNDFSASQTSGDAVTASSGWGDLTSMAVWPGNMQISLVTAPSAQTQGLISVVLPKGSLQVDSQIVISMGEQLEKFASGVPAGDVTVSLPNNLPLPSWIKYSAGENAFILKAVPSGALPMMVAMTFKELRFLVRISESGSVN